ncbi:MAG: hypothetical protein SGBAC_008912 [Bacillariaceae sp.]
MTNILDQCQVCGKEGKVHRCSRCKIARYCSIECQKSDWKAGHRKTCLLVDNKDGRATRALHELYSMTKGISVPEAKQRQDQATDVVEKQKKQDLLKKTTITFPIKEEIANNKSTATNNLPKKNPSANTNESQYQSVKINNVSFFLEEMKNIHQFQASLRPKGPFNQDAFEMLVEQTSEGSSQINFRSTTSDSDGVQFFIPLSRQLIPDQCSWNAYPVDGTIQLRLPFQELPMTDPELVSSLETLSPVDIINHIECRQCHQVLLPNQPIERTYFLPKGNWEEIADYISCFAGQPVIDFSSSADVQPLSAAQDANALCLNATDLGTTVCVLAVSGYGESTDMAVANTNLVQDSAVVRGNRMWQDAAGGATICCTQCCSVLGFASLESPETFRLLKHRLLIGSGGDPSVLPGLPIATESIELSSCASFLAREMVRYAESKAIFTFVIGVDDGEEQKDMCLLLRLVSWDTTIATEASSKEGDGLIFQKVAKVVYEEVVDEIGNNNNNNNNNTSEDPSQWVWGGVDLCCILPGVKESGNANHHNLDKVSTVRLQLPVDEYEAVKMDLQARSHLIPKSIKEATILIKMGGATTMRAKNNMDLTVIPLR